MTAITVYLTPQQLDVIDALAFLDERKGSVRRKRRDQTQDVVTHALDVAQLSPDVRAAVAARRRARSPLRAVSELHPSGGE